MMEKKAYVSPTLEKITLAVNERLATECQEGSGEPIPGCGDAAASANLDTPS